MVYLLALLSAAFYGAADFTGGFASRRAPMFTSSRSRRPPDSSVCS